VKEAKVHHGLQCQNNNNNNNINNNNNKKKREEEEEEEEEACGIWCKKDILCINSVFSFSYTSGLFKGLKMKKDRTEFMANLQLCAGKKKRKVYAPAYRNLQLR
jgi:hypothetical protein